MQLLSIVIITFNEENNIKACLDAVQGLSDDIIIMDSFSTDATEQICHNYPHLRFVKRAWEGFSATKNHANALARYPYILSLDADEVLSPTLRQSIENIENFNALFGFNRLTNYCGSWVHHCGWYPDRKIRIFPKEGSLWEGAYVHETLKTPSNLKEVWLKGDLWHYSYHSLEDHFRQIEKYSDLHARKMKAEGKKPSRMKEWISPAFKFFRTYLLQQGFRDGSAGYHIARISARAVALKYAKLRKMDF